MTPSDKTNEFQYAIRDIAESLYRSGNLYESQRSRITARDGQRMHRRWQRTRPQDWAFEAPIKASFALTDDITITLSGRADGMGGNEKELLIEEVKTVRPSSLLKRSQAEPHHLAQCRLYAALQAPHSSATLRVTYIEVNTGEQQTFEQVETATALEAFLQNSLQRLLDNILERQQWAARRQASCRDLAFPYATVRPEQDHFMERVDYSLRENATVLLEAPTGIGKTMGALYPALRQGAQQADILFYLTAKNTGKRLAEQALEDLGSTGAEFRSITLRAKAEMTCHLGVACGPHCPGAIGFFDRLQPALQDMRRSETAWTPDRIRHMAQKHTLCPFEFSLYISEWADVIVCDYNYVFDPRARLRRFFDKPSHPYVFLIDEVHNLPERGRDMLSASLDRKALRSLAKRLATTHPEIPRAISQIGREFTRLSKQSESPFAIEDLPDSLITRIQQAIDSCETALQQDVPAAHEDDLLDLYFSLLEFMSAAELFADTHRLLYEKSGPREVIKIFCLDPSNHLASGLKQARAAVGFSATLMPPAYYIRLLGQESTQLVFRFASPFPPEHLHIKVQTDIRTTYQHRTQSMPPLADRLAEFIHGHAGKYLVFIPSYAFLQQLLQAYSERDPFTPTLVQVPGMTTEARQEFLRAFEQPRTDSLVGFAVMGGVFAEGIDLVGDQLTGAVIIGAGLPQLGFERQLIRQYFDQLGERGFDMAYTWPGWTRVAQAAGRIIRSEEDRGRLLLIDHRFAWPLYTELFPPHWRIG